jgi:hypothetical protein
MIRIGLAVFALALVYGLASPPAAAQYPRTTLTSDTVTVGDVFRAVVRVRVPAGSRAVFPDSLEIAGDVENAGRRFVNVDTIGGNDLEYTVAYPVAAWRPGDYSLPLLEFQLTSTAEGARTIRAMFPYVNVRSVLPADTAGIEPRPARDVLGSNRLLWPWLLAALLASLGLLALALWLTLRRPVEALAPAIALPPRQRALAALDRALELRLLEAGDFKAFYDLTSEALRHYVADLNAEWSADLTTSELLDRFDGNVEVAAASALRELLLGADLVKFARRRPAVPVARAEWQAARTWVEQFDWPPAAAAPVAEPVPAEAA